MHNIMLVGWEGDFMEKVKNRHIHEKEETDKYVMKQSTEAFTFPLNNYVK